MTTGEVLLTILAAVGAAFGLTHSDLAAPLRNLFPHPPKPAEGEETPPMPWWFWIGHKLTHCLQCVGFWTGLACGWWATGDVGRAVAFAFAGSLAAFMVGAWLGTKGRPAMVYQATMRPKREAFQATVGP